MSCSVAAEGLIMICGIHQYTCTCTLYFEIALEHLNNTMY